MELIIRIVVGLPAGENGILFVGLKQGSGPGLLTGAVVEVTCVEVNCNVGRVGSGNGVCEAVGGKGVGLGLSVGGTSVEVGLGGCASARIVSASAIVVSCTSAGSIIGVGCAPQAMMSRVMNKPSPTSFRCFMVLEVLPMRLTVGETTPLRYDAFIPDNNFPAPLGDAETAQDFKIFLTTYKCECTVLSYRTHG